MSRCWAQCWDAGPSPTSSTSAPGWCQPLCHADALLSEHNWNHVPSHAVLVHTHLAVWGVYLLIHHLKKKRGKRKGRERRKKKKKKTKGGIKNGVLQVSGSSTWWMPSSSKQPRPPMRARGSSSPSLWLLESAHFFFFFKRGPISFTNEGPTVPGRICYGPARRPSGIVLPSAPTGAHCPRPQRGLLAADLSGPASRRPGPPLRSWPRRWGLSPGDL